jgi:hypothetical protein
MELGANIVRLWFDLRAPSPNSEPAPSVLCGIRSLPLFVAPLKIRWRPGEGTAGRRRPGHGQTEELPAAAARRGHAEGWPAAVVRVWPHVKASRPLFSVLVINDNHYGLTFLFEL